MSKVTLEQLKKARVFLEDWVPLGKCVGTRGFTISEAVMKAGKGDRAFHCLEALRLKIRDRGEGEMLVPWEDKPGRTREDVFELVDSVLC